MNSNKSEADKLYEQLNAKLKRAAAKNIENKLATGEYIKVGDRVQPNPDHDNFRNYFYEDEDENSEQLDRIEAALDSLTKLVDSQLQKLDVVIEDLVDKNNGKD